ncbi:hypothetical protein [Hydrogenophaga sp.]|uniref:hypothetical protein n=1 Tax=Hydrogenophaga sp. TaxID=1904254 RepID=UPI0035AE69A9
MNTLTSRLQRSSAWGRGLLAMGLVAGAWALSAGQAQARDDVYWSVGVAGPGVSIGASNAPAVVYHRPPAYYVDPRPVVVAPPVVYSPPVVVPARPVVIGAYGPGYWRDDYRGRRHWHGHHDHRRDWDDDDRRPGRIR